MSELSKKDAASNSSYRLSKFDPLNDCVEWSTELILNHNLSPWALRLYLLFVSKINSNDPDNYTVRFAHNELQKIYNEVLHKSGNLKREQVCKGLNDLFHLYNYVVGENGQYRMVHLFSSQEGPSDENGYYELTATLEGREIFFNIASAAYTYRKLVMYLELVETDSVYPLLIYRYLLTKLKALNAFPGRYYSWYTTYDEILECLKIETKMEFKYFKRDILKKAVEIIRNVTDIDLPENFITKENKKLKFTAKFKNKNLIEQEEIHIRQMLIDKASDDKKAQIKLLINDDKNKKYLVSDKDVDVIIKEANENNVSFSDLKDIIIYTMARKHNIKSSLTGYIINAIRKGFVKTAMQEATAISYESNYDIKKTNNDLNKLPNTKKWNQTTAPTSKSLEALKEIEHLYMQEVINDSDEINDSDDNNTDNKS